VSVLRIALWGAVAMFVAVLGWQVFEVVQRPPNAAIAIGTPFDLARADGGRVASTELEGKPYAVFFGFTHCPEVCPTTLYGLSQLLPTLGPAAADLRVFFITVDPARDTAPFLANYLANFDPRIEGLVPTAPELPSLAKGFRVFYEKVPTSDGEYTMNHTASVFLFGRDGTFAGTLAYGEDMAISKAKLARLIGATP
jgi:protein SCO1